MSFRNTRDYDHASGEYEKQRLVAPETLSLLKRALHHLKHGQMVLSLGCGTGQYESALRRMGFAVTGMDLSIGMAGIAQNRRLDIVLGNMADLPFRSSTFHAVIMNQSFHHVGGSLSISSSQRKRLRQDVINECRRVLRDPGGQVILIQSSPKQNAAVWFWKYFPEALERKLKIQPEIDELISYFRQAEFNPIRAIPYSAEIIDGFYSAQAPLKAEFRSSFSEFSYLAENEVADGISRLRTAILNGEVDREIEASRERFRELGGNLIMVTAALK